MLMPFSHAHVFCFMQLRGDGESVLSQDDDPQRRRWRKFKATEKDWISDEADSKVDEEAS
jgi:hypothetical protein